MPDDSDPNEEQSVSPEVLDEIARSIFRPGSIMTSPITQEETIAYIVKTFGTPDLGASVAASTSFSRDLLSTPAPPDFRPQFDSIKLAFEL